MGFFHLPRAILIAAVIAAFSSGARADDGEGPAMAPEKRGPAEACGKPLEAASEEPSPALTPKLLSLAAAYPKLEEDLERTHQCVNANAAGCEARKKREGGGELAAEVTSLNLKKEKDQLAFMKIVKEGEPADARDWQAVVTQGGFRRKIQAHVLLYGINDHAQFHLHAGGVAQVNGDAVKAERKAQARLLEIFAEMEAELDEKKDEDSLKVLSFFKEEARKSESNLGLLACDLDQKLAQNNEIEARMKAIIPETDAGSSVTGAVPEQGRYLGGGGVSGSAAPAENVGRAPATAEAEILDSVPAYRGYTPHAGTPGREDPEADLFRRVHRKYRELDAHGSFIPGLWEVAPPLQFP